MYSDFFTNTHQRRHMSRLSLLCMLLAASIISTPAAWSADTEFLTIGPFEQGVYDGSAPFGVTDDCTQAGDDCSNNDQRIRTNDVLQFVWSVAAGGLSNSAEAVDAVIVKQTIIPGSGATVQFLGIPAACLAPPAGNGGNSPESVIVENADGSTTLTCNLGSIGNGEQKSYSVAVAPQTSSLNGSEFTTTQIVYGLDDRGRKIAEEFEYLDPTNYTISAAPAFDLIGNRVTINRGEVINADIGNGIEPGFLYQYTAHIATAPDRGVLGIEPLGNSFTFSPGIYATLPDGVTPFDLQYSVIECAPNQFEWGASVYGSQPDESSLESDNAVTDSGDCSIAGNADNGYQLTISNADTTGNQYPAETLDGSSLAAGPFIVGAYSLKVFVPFSEIDRADGTLGNQIGQLQLGACLSDFNPDSITGVSNYLDDLEPGYNGTAMPTGDASNNCAGVTEAKLTTDGEFVFRAQSTETDAGTSTRYAPLISSFHAGDGVAEPGQSYATMLFFRNNGGTPLTDFTACSVFDNTVQTITDRGNIGATPGAYAYEGTDTLAGFDPSQWQIHYGVAQFVGDDPLDADGDNTPDLNPVTGRFEGRWSRLAKLRCDSAAIEWHTDLSTIDPNAVNAVRFSPVTTGTRLEVGQEIRLITPLSLRTRFSGGPRDGDTIPSGTVAASYGSYRSNERNPDWNTNTYKPAPENTSADGDRMTIARATIATALETASPQAATGVVETVLAGNSVVWKLNPVVVSQNFDGETIDNLTLTLHLSAGSTYNPGCTLTTPGGVSPSTATLASDDNAGTQLTWSLGDISANSSIEPLLVCIDTDPFLDAGTAISATVTTTAENAVSSQSPGQSVSLGQAGAILTDVTVANSLTVPNADQSYVLRWANFSNAAIIKKPTLINVLPFNGDSSGLSARNPASTFNGTFTLAAEPVVRFLNGDSPSASENPIGKLYYTADNPETIAHNPAVNQSNWCTFNGTRFDASAVGTECPADWSKVTAIKFESAYDLNLRGTERQGMTLSYTANTSGNATGDSYTNVFAVDSASLPIDQILVSRRGSVKVVSFSIEGTVFAVLDGDLDYDEGIDAIVPDGITVELLNSKNNTVIDSVGTENGQYQFTSLLPGNYIVSIPASIFGPTGNLPGWTAATADNSRDNIIDVNFGEPDNVGIRTHVISLNTTSTEANRPTPTVDLALQPNDADADGISDLTEFGENAFIIDGVDTDGDGIPDYRDTDSDGDSISDEVEGNIDTDGDGLANYIDTDSDADGIPDSAEGGSDTDGDGIPDFLDNINSVDTDGDGITNAFEGTVDTDGDGIIDSEDTDSDADGIDDSVEMNTDTDGDGIPNYIDTDSDADGIDDSIEGTEDRDNNGVPDYIDNQTDADSDGDNIPDIFDGNTDTDGDGIVNSEDLDSDEDGIADEVETIHDADGDGIPNFLDLDSDNDSIPDQIETARDSDNDQIPDYVDLDSDNDSLTDVQETSRLERDIDGDGRIDNIIDSNADGIDDATQSTGVFVIDTDFDGVPDFIDLDSDNDGIPDVIETLGPSVDQNRDGVLDIFIDEDGNGRDEESELALIFVVDIDQDGIPNSLDLDSDGDNRADVRESGGEDRNGDFIIDPMTDSDRDSVQEQADADQTGGFDADADGIDDSSDSDYVNEPDTDGDGIIDNMDPDADGDGYVDRTFSDPQLGNEYPDFDTNGTPDFQQPLTGVITSGVGGEGIGCSIARTDRIDPTLLLLLLLSGLGLIRHRTAIRIARTR